MYSICVKYYYLLYNYLYFKRYKTINFRNEKYFHSNIQIFIFIPSINDDNYFTVMLGTQEMFIYKI